MQKIFKIKHKKMHIAIGGIFLGVFIIMSFQHFKRVNIQQSNTTQIRYIALGDSYTIGEGLSENERWPNQLVKKLNENNIDIKLVASPSKTGWTTKKVIDSELPIFDNSNADFVTLQIGVNDYVQQLDIDIFHKNLIQIIEHIQNHLKIKTNLLLVTIPDFGVTKTGKSYSYGRNTDMDLKEFNKIILDEGKLHKLNTIDIFDLSKEMENNTDLVFSDQLHPSGKEYEKWTDKIFPVAFSILKQ